MNVIFLNSIYGVIPQRSISPYILKHYIAKRGYTSQVIDYCQDFTGEELFEYIEHFITNNTLCLAVSSTFWYDEAQYYYTYDNGIPPNIHQAIKLTKQKYPHIKVILGGAHSGYMTKRIEDVDCVFISESEDTLPELLEHWTKGTESPPYTTNVLTKKKTYRYPLNKTYDIEKCDFRWTDSDCIIPGETLPLETSRGCIFKCKFCAFPHLGKAKFDYLKSNEYLKQHLIENKEKYGVTNYIMLDDTFNDSEYKIDSFLEMTKQLSFEINYSAYIRADLVHRFDGMAEKLFDSGLRGAFFGLESIHPRASMIVGKGWSGKDGREYIPKLVNEIWKKKVFTISGLIVGLPEEQLDDLLGTLRWANNNNLPIIFFGLLVTKNFESRPFVSEFERDAEKYNFNFDANDQWYNQHWNRQSVLRTATELNNKRKNNTVACFNYSALKSLGFTDDEMSIKHRLDLIENNPEFYDRKKKFISEYKLRLKRLTSSSG